MKTLRGGWILFLILTASVSARAADPASSTNAAPVPPTTPAVPGTPNDDLLRRASEAVTSHADSKVFDSLLVDLADAVAQSRTGTYDRATYLKLESAERFVREWQDYLVHKAQGNSQQASNDLRELANNTSSFMPIPRSELLTRAMKESAQATKAVDTTVEIKSFDDLPDAISHIEVLQRSGNYSNEMNMALNAMQSMENAYQAYQNQNYAAALQQLQNEPYGMVNMTSAAQSADADSPGKPGSLNRQLSVLKNKLIIEIAQALLALPDPLAPKEDERGADYLLRVAAHEKAAADWTGLQKVLQVYSQLSPFNSAPWLAQDTTGIRDYLIGEKLEAAGQNLDAIRSYRQSLATLGRFFPAEPPVAKLKELQKKYPDLYQQALQLPIDSKGP